MIRASDLKKGDVIRLEGDPHMVETISVQTPSARGAASLYKVRLRNLQTKRKTDGAFRGDDVFPEADFERRPVQLLYGDDRSMTFMDLKDYGQFTLSREDLESEWPYLFEGIEGVLALVSGDRVLGLELPLMISLPIAETGPPARSGSATARTKPATLKTGLVVQVPEHLATGDVIRVDTRSGDYAGKA